MRRITTLALVALTFFAVSTTAGAEQLGAANCQCGTLVANGHGWVGVWATGNTWGSLTSGTLWVRDRDGKHRFTVTHYASKTWLADLKAWRYKGSGLRFQAWGRWWVKAQGTGIAVSATAQGTAHLEGTGKYHLNGGPAHAWPSPDPRQLQLRD